MKPLMESIEKIDGKLDDFLLSNKNNLNTVKEINFLTGFMLC